MVESAISSLVLTRRNVCKTQFWTTVLILFSTQNQNQSKSEAFLDITSICLHLPILYKRTHNLSLLETKYSEVSAVPSCRYFQHSNLRIRVLALLLVPPGPLKSIYNFISMDRHWLHSPVKYFHQTLNTSTEIVQLTQFLHIQGFANTTPQHICHRRLFTNRIYKRRSKQLELVLRDLCIRKLGLAFQILRRSTLRTVITQTSSEGAWNVNLQAFEMGFVQLDYVIKSQQQKDKVMAFTFIKNVYKRRKILQKTLISLGKFANRKRQNQREQTFKYITQYALTRPRLNQYRFALKFLEKIILSEQAHSKKMAFQLILRRALERMKAQQPPKAEVPQHIFLVNQRHHSRKKSQTVYVRVPVLSQKIQLQELNISARRKHRRSISTVKKSVKASLCMHYSQSESCRFCETPRVLNY